MNENTQDPDLLEGEDTPQITHSEKPSPIMLEDSGEADDGLQQERQDAFDGGEYEWKGKPLFPYTSSRDSLFSRMRHSMGAPDIKDAVMDPSLFVGDAHLILFLCSHDELYLARRIGKPDELLVTMFAWVDENVPSDDTNDAVTQAYNIFFQKTTNSAEQAPDDNPHDSPELGN